MDEIIDFLIEKLAPDLALAFLDAMRSARSQVNFAALQVAIEAGDIEGAVEALDIDAGDFNGYVLARQNIAMESGAAVAKELTLERARVMQSAPPMQPPVIPGYAVPGGAPISFRFDMQNPLAEQRLRSMAAESVTYYTDGQKEIARKVIADGYARGEGPQTIATDIAGRINPATKRREGGIIGLSGHIDPTTGKLTGQASYVQNMRLRLTSDDPLEMAKVLGRFGKDGKWIEGTGMTLRDRRFDSQIQRAIRDVMDGKPNPLTAAKVDEMTAKYSDRLLMHRAQVVARTETAQGVELARAETTRQALDKAGLPDDAVTKGWEHQGGPRNARDWHLAMHGRTVVGMDTLFILPDGSRMLYPHDPDGGAHNNANCGCRSDMDINWLWGLL